MSLTKRERGAIKSERYLKMEHDCRAMGLPAVHCPLHEGWIRDDDVTGHRVVMVELSYPPRETEPTERPNPSVIEVGLMHVRAADNLRISYDFARDGWSIKQASTFSWSVDEVEDEDWQEVAFVQAWGRKKPDSD